MKPFWNPTEALPTVTEAPWNPLTTGRIDLDTQQKSLWNLHEVSWKPLNTDVLIDLLTESFLWHWLFCVVWQAQRYSTPSKDKETKEVAKRSWTNQELNPSSSALSCWILVRLQYRILTWNGNQTLTVIQNLEMTFYVQALVVVFHAIKTKNFYLLCFAMWKCGWTFFYSFYVYAQSFSHTHGTLFYPKSSPTPS